MRVRITSQEGYAGIRLFSIHNEWLEKRRQAVRGTDHIISYLHSLDSPIRNAFIAIGTVLGALWLNNLLIEMEGLAQNIACEWRS
jgi:hypothetical protein